jgi:hypothetical protein
MEETAINIKSVKHTLDHGRKQLPSHLPGVIFVKIPHSWLPTNSYPRAMYGTKTTEISIIDRLEEVAKDFLRGTGKIVSVEFYSAGLIFEDGKVTSSTAGLAVINENHRFDKSKLWKLMPDGGNRFDQTPPIWWVSLRGFH